MQRNVTEKLGKIVTKKIGSSGLALCSAIFQLLCIIQM